LSNEEVERRRRSIAMLTTGAPSGLTREEAMEILEELQRCRSCGRRLLGAMREVRATADRTLRSLRGPEG
jgi:ribosomal protein L34E